MTPLLFFNVDTKTRPAGRVFSVAASLFRSATLRRSISVVYISSLLHADCKTRSLTASLVESCIVRKAVGYAVGYSVVYSNDDSSAH